MDTSVTLFGRRLKNPVIPASGTFGFGSEFAEYYDLNVLGGIALKGTTLEPRYGNPQPRIAECPSGIINAIGLQNPGADAVAGEEIPRLAALFDGAIIANVGGHSEHEYVAASEKLAASPHVFAIELNISCPNVKGGGMAFGTDAETAKKLVYAVKTHIKKPLIVKLSPNVTDIAGLALAVRDGGADAVSLINTLVGMRIDLRTRRPIISVRTGGVSGPAVFPVALRMVNDVARAVDSPVIGMGGVDSAEGVLEMMMAGACAVQVGAANLVDPYACRDIVAALPGVMASYRVQNLTDIIGAAV